MPTIHGIEADQAGRCCHYHSENDIAGLKCAQCQQYFACYQCHDELMDHRFVPCDKEDTPVICGICRKTLTFNQYKLGACPFCHHPFNPKCALHETIYFK